MSGCCSSQHSKNNMIFWSYYRRRKKSSTVFYSQYDPSDWYEQIGGDNSPLAEAILDRIKYDAYKINIIPMDPTNYRSMWKTRFRKATGLLRTRFPIQ
jgi:DNA replication protein DnaC